MLGFPHFGKLPHPLQTCVGSLQAPTRTPLVQKLEYKNSVLALGEGRVYGLELFFLERAAARSRGHCGIDESTYTRGGVDVEIVQVLSLAGHYVRCIG